MACLSIRPRTCATILAFTLSFSGTPTTGSFLVVRTDQNDNEDLSPLNATTKRELSGDEVHSYGITIDSGQYVQVIVEQWGIDLSLALYAPDGYKINELNCRQDRPTRVSLISQSSGTYSLKVSSLKENAVGCYQIKMGDIRPAQTCDRHRVSAEKAFALGERLRAEWRLESEPRAIEKYEEALSHWRAAGEKREEANTLRQIGEVYNLLSKPQKALKYFNQALRLSQDEGDREGEGEALSDIGNVYLLLENKTKALEYCTRALNLSQAIADRRGEAQALNSMGEVHEYLSNMPKALRLHHQALELWRDLKDRRGQAQALLDLGYTYYVLSDTQKAFESFKEALPLWRAVDDHRGESLTLTAIGHLSSILGEKQDALDLYEKAMWLVKPSGDRHSEANILNGIGYVYDEMGEKQKALEYYKQGLHLFQVVNQLDSQADTLRVIGEVYYSLGDNRLALDYYEQALSVAMNLADQQIEPLVRRRIGMVYNSWGNKTKALDYCKQALLVNQAVGNRRDEAYTLSNIGQIYYGSGQKDKAVDYYEQALAISRSVGDRVGESLTLYSIAQAQRACGNLGEARNRLEQALKIIESLRTKVVSQELRSSYFASERHCYDSYIDLLMQMHKQRPTEGLSPAALQASERARARSLVESLSEGRADIRQGVDPALLERERSLLQSLNGKLDRQMRLPSGKPDREEAEVLAKEIRDLTTAYEELQAQIKSKSPHYAALTQPQPLSLGEIQKRVVDDDSLLLEYALGDEHSYLWAIAHSTMHSYELPKRAEIEKMAHTVYDLLVARQPKTGETAKQYQTRVSEADSQYWTQAAALSQIVLGPVAEQLGTKRLLIVAEGALQYVPFEGLPVPGKGDEGTEGRGDVGTLGNGDVVVPLVVNHEIVNLPSASVLAVLRNEIHGRRVADKTIAVIADPVFETDDPRVMHDAGTRGKGDVVKSERRVATTSVRPHAAVPPLSGNVSDFQRALRDVRILRQGVRSISRLLSSRDEADAIMAMVPAGEGMKAMDFKASRATATSSDLGQYRIVHFATHGLLDSEHPESSGLVLSLVDEQGKGQNGFLGLHDIYNLNLPVDLVVLSACNTALGKEVRGEGLVGIVRGFMYAGAARVVASLWKVDDEATAELMRRFYQRMLQDNMRPAAALRAAQVEMWQQKRWHAPYYWAAFVLQGEFN